MTQMEKEALEFLEELLKTHKEHCIFVDFEDRVQIIIDKLKNLQK